MQNRNTEFQYPKSIQAFIVFSFIAFLALFLFTIMSVVGVFDSEIFSTSVASLNDVNY